MECENLQSKSHSIALGCEATASFNGWRISMTYPLSYRSNSPGTSTYISTNVSNNESFVDVETDPKWIAQRASVVQDVYNQLFAPPNKLPGANAVVLTGINGVGKSTLAGLL